MPHYNDYSSPVKQMIDNAIVRGTEVANDMIGGMTCDQLMALNLISYVYDQSCIALALALSANEIDDPYYAPSAVRMAMRGRLCDSLRVTA